MNFAKKIQIGTQILRSRYAKKKQPLAVGWSLTKKCNFNCRYCGSIDRVGPEMSDPQLLLLAQQMIDAGVMKISLTGGEPLMKDVVTDLVPLLSKNDISVTLDTNAIRLPKMIDQLKGLDGLLLSLDGPKEINDSIRGPGAYDATIEALQIAKDRKLKAVATCVLSSWNLDTFEHVLEQAEKFKTRIQFQPAIAALLGTSKDNPGTPNPEHFHRAIIRLIELKKGPYKKQIGNSVAGLNHLKKWPEPTRVRCISGLLSCRIEPDGAMYHCGRVIANTDNPPNVLDAGFRAAFEKLKPFFCTDCWCAQRVELALASDFNLHVIKNMLGIY